MEQWVRLCSLAEAPCPGEVIELDASGVAICLANVNGTFAAMDNWCPHRRGSLGQGWVEGNAVVCPLHSWTFDVSTGMAHEPERAKVEVFRLKVQSDAILIDLG